MSSETSAPPDSASSLRLTPLSASRAEDVLALQRLLEQAPAFSLRVTGHLPSPDEALRSLRELPPGKTLDDKFAQAIWLGPELVGCGELLRAYPDEETAYVGLLLFAEAYQGRGLGQQVMPRLCDLARSWGCTKLRVAVIKCNEQAMRFWSAQGFVPVFEVPQTDYLDVAVVMDRML